MPGTRPDEPSSSGRPSAFFGSHRAPQAPATPADRRQPPRSRRPPSPDDTRRHRRADRRSLRSSKPASRSSAVRRHARDAGSPGPRRRSTTGRAPPAERPPPDTTPWPRRVAAPSTTMRTGRRSARPWTAFRSKPSSSPRRAMPVCACGDDTRPELAPVDRPVDAACTSTPASIPTSNRPRRGASTIAWTDATRPPETSAVPNGSGSAILATAAPPASRRTGSRRAATPAASRHPRSASPLGARFPRGQLAGLVATTSSVSTTTSSSRPSSGCSPRRPSDTSSVSEIPSSPSGGS